MSSEAYKMLVCKNCRTLLANEINIESKTFHGQSGPAVLITRVHNITVAKPTQRWMVTGCHVIRWVSCAGCKSAVGWTYVAVDDERQKYKLGKFVLETEQLEKIRPPPLVDCAVY
ncbi:Yippee-like protein [Metarhizium album ARSEF 1941]|uniref:Protein yippee-like n=1 Tax=Metarhizium album (strain ARSEF 1941) TaxID=1081103 RepID=A0A0B2WY99_METAS|nr:Yippee-like protein [Metarhizium album ARSEF 1941]KHN98392.1 Yippee-like protein [Metarhizium album ARSEF 1941]